MLTAVEQDAFYVTNDGSIVIVVVEEDQVGHAWLLVLSGGLGGLEPGSDYFLDKNGAIQGEEHDLGHPLLPRQRLDIEFPSLRDWNPLSMRSHQGFPQSLEEWKWILSDVQQILLSQADHVPPTIEHGKFYRTLNDSIVFVLSAEPEETCAVVLKGGVAGRRPGGCDRISPGSAPGRPNTRGFVFALAAPLPLQLPTTVQGHKDGEVEHA